MTRRQTDPGFDPTSANYEVYTYQGAKINDGASIVMTFTSPNGNSFCTSGNAQDIAFKGVNLAAPVRSFASASNNGANVDPALTLSSSYDDVVFEFLANARGTSPPNGMVPASGQTVRSTHDNGGLSPISDNGCVRYSDGESSTCTVAHDSTIQGQPTYNAQWSSTPADGTGQRWGYSAVSVSSPAAVGGPTSGPPPEPLPIPIACPSSTEVVLTDTRPESANVVVYNWDWGDGTTTQTSSHTVTHNYTAAGQYTITMRAQDISGRIDTFQGTVDLNAPGCHILYGAQIIGPYILALLILMAFVLLVQLIFGKKGKLRLALIITIIALVIIVAVFIYFGWAPELPGHIKF